MLLDKGADVNAQGGRYDNALYAASSRGHEKVKILLSKGACNDLIRTLPSALTPCLDKPRMNY